MKGFSLSKKLDLKQELTIWCTPIVFFYLVLLLLNRSDFLSNGQYWYDTSRLFSSILFFNATHVVLGFLGLLFIQEMRDWWTDFEWKKSFFLLTVLLPAIYLVWLYTNSYSDNFLWNFTRVTLIFLSLHHAAMQTYGLLVVGKSKKEKRILRHLFLFLVVLFGASRYARLVPSISLFWVDWTTFFASSLTMLLIYRVCWHRKSDRIFLIRIVLFPLGQIFSVAAIGISAIHGVEYLVLLKRQFGNTRSKSVVLGLNGKSFSYFSIFLMYLGLALVNERSGLFSVRNMDRFEEIGALLMTSWIVMDLVSLPHYFLDGVMYRFSNKNSRSKILPLLR